MDARTEIVDAKALKDLWAEYLSTHSIESRNLLIETHLPIVKQEAKRMAAALTHAVRPQELESAGTLGLIDSIENFEPEQGFKFITFCTPRIRGAMLDELRSWDWTPRATRAKINKLERASKGLEFKLGRQPEPAEISRETGMSEHEIQRIHSDKSRTLISLDQSRTDESNSVANSKVIADKRSVDPVGALQRKEISEIVRKSLNKTERLVVTLYYYEQLNLREIGQVLGLTESRICQIHSKIVNRLKKLLN